MNINVNIITCIILYLIGVVLSAHLHAFADYTCWQKWDLHEASKRQHIQCKCEWVWKLVWVLINCPYACDCIVVISWGSGTLLQQSKSCGQLTTNDRTPLEYHVCCLLCLALVGLKLKFCMILYEQHPVESWQKFYISWFLSICPQFSHFYKLCGRSPFKADRSLSKIRHWQNQNHLDLQSLSYFQFNVLA